MSLSVILIVYERIDHLRLALLSLGRQRHAPDEVIIADDGSNADVLGALREGLGDGGYRLIYVRQEDRGFRAAKCRNNAVRHAGGEYLVFLDQDVVSTPGYLGLFADHGRRGEFLVAWPVLLSEEQSRKVDRRMVASGALEAILTGQQRATIRRRYLRDRFYHDLRKVLRRWPEKPRLRSSVFGIHRDDFLKVDGFDENYQGWGLEDDDLNRRLYRVGVVGRTVFRTEFPLHLWHPHVTGGRRSENYPYHRGKDEEIARGHYRARNGLSNPLGENDVKVVMVRG
jgi:hypothetical protein